MYFLYDIVFSFGNDLWLQRSVINDDIPFGIEQWAMLWESIGCINMGFNGKNRL